MPSPILKYFAFEHLPPKLQEVSKPIGELAQAMDEKLPEGAEKSAGLRKLLEAKDCLVRALLPVVIFLFAMNIELPSAAAEGVPNWTKAEEDAYYQRQEAEAARIDYLGGGMAAYHLESWAAYDAIHGKGAAQKSFEDQLRRDGRLVGSNLRHVARAAPDEGPKPDGHGGGGVVAMPDAVEVKAKMPPIGLSREDYDKYFKPRGLRFLQAKDGTFWIVAKYYPPIPATRFGVPLYDRDELFVDQEFLANEKAKDQPKKKLKVKPMAFARPVRVCDGTACRVIEEPTLAQKQARWFRAMPLPIIERNVVRLIFGR